MDTIVAPALARAGELEAALGLPRGSIPLLTSGLVVLLSVLVLLGLLPCCGGGARRAGGAPVRSAKAIRNTVLLVGPPGSGKTAMLHRLAFGKAVATVPSVVENTLRAQVGGASVTLVDFPGIGQLRPALLRRAAESGALVVVLDATGGAEHDTLAADLIADLFTTPAVYDARPPVLMAVNKSDSPRARSIEQVRSSLEAQLRMLQDTRGGNKGVRVAAATEDGRLATGGAAGQAAEAASTVPSLLLGTEGRPFTFAEDSPSEVTWCAAVSGGRAGAQGAGQAGGGKGAAAAVEDGDAVTLGEVEDFISAAVSAK